MFSLLFIEYADVKKMLTIYC